MTRYKCPYCLPRYQFSQQRSDGVMVCGQCGEPLLKVPLIKPTQIIALIAVSSFIAPFILIIFDYMKKELNRDHSQPTLIFLLKKNIQF